MSAMPPAAAAGPTITLDLPCTERLALDTAVAVAAETVNEAIQVLRAFVAGWAPSGYEMDDALGHYEMLGAAARALAGLSAALGQGHDHGYVAELMKQATPPTATADDYDAP